MNKMSKEEFRQSVEAIQRNLHSHTINHSIQYTKELIERYKDHDPVLAQFMQNDLDNLESVKAHLSKKLEITK